MQQLLNIADNRFPNLGHYNVHTFPSEMTITIRSLLSDHLVPSKTVELAINFYSFRLAVDRTNPPITLWLHVGETVKLMIRDVCVSVD